MSCTQSVISAAGGHNYKWYEQDEYVWAGAGGGSKQTLPHFSRASFMAQKEASLGDAEATRDKRRAWKHELVSGCLHWTRASCMRRSAGLCRGKLQTAKNRDGQQTTVINAGCHVPFKTHYLFVGDDLAHKARNGLRITGLFQKTKTKKKAAFSFSSSELSIKLPELCKLLLFHKSRILVVTFKSLLLLCDLFIF